MAYSYTDQSVTPSQAGINADGAAGSFNYQGPTVTIGRAAERAAFWASRDSEQWGIGGPAAGAAVAGASPVGGLLLLGLMFAAFMARRRG